jgi:hypothetical protein
MSIKNNFYYHDKDKYEELLKVSNLKKVNENAIKYLNDPDIVLYISTQKNKKYMLYDKEKTHKTHFVDIRYSDFTKHNDLERREAYLRRATNLNGHWRDCKYSPNNLSIHLLWQ